MTLTTLRTAGDLPAHPTLLHPHTGLPIRAIGYRKDGRAIWPIIGGDGTDDAGGDKPADTESDHNAGRKPDDQLGDGGKAALAAERKARKDAEKRAADAEAKAKEYDDRDKTEQQKTAERAEAAEKRAAEAEARALRLEVAQEKGLTAAQAKRLVGSTREELEADADELVEAFGKPADGKPAGKKPKPDPAQGARPGDKATSLDAGRSLYAERHKKKTTTST